MENLPDKKYTFEVPENYFETLADRTWAKIVNPAAAAQTPRRKTRLVRLLWPVTAIAAVTLLFILFKNYEVESSSQLNEIPAAQAINYLDENADDIDLQQMIESGEIALPPDNVASIQDSILREDSILN